MAQKPLEETEECSPEAENVTETQPEKKKDLKTKKCCQIDHLIITLVVSF